ncbi:MAG TPA: MipA/OmpV family protein [Candidatus Methylomirabilis sp.]|nr:MipA/OmpV family protein [Candidatus Methylomirabilis sp.]
MRQMIISAILTVGLAATPVSAAELPRWEIGLGVGGLSIPDYRGSDQRRSYVLPLPYVQYRGDVFRIDDEGAHGDLFASDRVKLEISLAAGVPAKSDRNDARTGMPNLDPTVEAGPSLHFDLARNESRDRVWSLRFPLRAAAAVDLHHVQRIGWVFAPNLNFDALQVRGGWDLGVAVGPIYATEDNHDYYYEVAPEFATATRPAYDAPGGYSGSRLTLTANRRFPTFWVGAFARYDNLSGAVFENSPLVKRKDSFMAGVGIAWILAEASHP